MFGFKQFIKEAKSGEAHVATTVMTGVDPHTHMGHISDLGGVLRSLPGDHKIFAMSSKSKAFSDEDRKKILTKQTAGGIEPLIASEHDHIVAHAWSKVANHPGKKVLHLVGGQDRKGMVDRLVDSMRSGKIKNPGFDEIHGHTPEGAERINKKLSEERAAAIEKFYRAQMKKYDYAGKADSINFILKPVVEDWAEFKTALAAYEGITSEEKSAFLNIVNNGSDFEAQEKELKKLSSYKKVFKEVYPGLRAAKTEILTVKDKKTDAEISVLAKQITQSAVSADTLSFEEMMYAATLTPSLDEKAAIYEAATKKGTNWTAHNNLGAVYIAQAMENSANATDLANKAKAQLDIAAKLNEAGEVHANLASVHMMLGNSYAAYNHAKKALAKRLSADNTRGVNGVKGAAEIVKAMYADAVSSTSSATDNADNAFNKGLAQVLNKDYQNAVTSFGEATSKNANLAIAHYGAAVAQARLGNADKVVESLAAAVKIDANLKQAALSDLEFSKFAANEAFRNALK